MPKSNPDRRTYMPLQATRAKPALSLDSSSLDALNHAAHLVAAHHRLKPHLSAIARRALIRYGMHLDGLTREGLVAEAQHVFHTSKANP